MKFSVLAVFSAFAVTVSAITPPDYSKSGSGNPIYTPGLKEQVPVGKPYEITWNPTTEGKISLQLLRGPSNNVVPIATLADSVDNTGSFSWTPSKELESDTSGYGLLIVVEGTGQYQYSTQFGIKNDNQTPDKEPTAAPTDAPTATPSDDTRTLSTPMVTVTETVCDVCPPNPTGNLPTATHSPTSYSANPTPTPSSDVPIYDGAASRKSVGLAGGAVVAIAAVLAF